MSNEKTDGKLIVLVAPSGAGKTTLAQRLLADFSRLRFSISATTRPPRAQETDGKDYFFITEKEFESKISRNQFVEWEFYNGHRYGTLCSEVEKMMKKGYFPLLDIEVKGALNVKRLFAERCESIFIQPPSIEELRRRLLKRGSETDKSLNQRLKRAEQELVYANHFDFIVVNDDLETAYKQIKTIVQSFTGAKTN